MRAARRPLGGSIRGARPPSLPRSARWLPPLAGALCLLGAGLCVLAASAARAIAAPIDARATAFGGYFDALCEGDCGAGGLPAGVRPGGGRFDFELALVGRKSGFDLSLVTGGAVYLVFPVDAEEIVLQTGGSIGIDSGALPPGLRPPRGDGGAILCACVEVVGGGGSISSGGEITIGSRGDLGFRPRVVAAHAAVSGIAPSVPMAVSLARTGDVYLDLSGIRLGRLFVEAAGGIRVGPASFRPVPEPGPALLVALGLAALAARSGCAGSASASPRRRTP